ncbi:MAG TPA: PQQ-dependent sugar dehydrogenase, partial [Chitinophagaceae bacterium]|nr:PQQ-dependent sugar dehydrogenase [Chitinophagaceae bacterium]
MKKFLFFSVLVILMAPVFGQSLPSGFAYTNATVGATWSAPVGATFTPDGLRLFVWEKRGRVYVCNRNGSNYSKQTTPVIDISAEVLNDRDFGLVGFALDPNFQANGYI